MLTADVDHDGHGDLVVIDNTRVGVAFGDGAGGFPANVVVDVSLGGAPHTVWTSDLNKDGMNDLIVGSTAGTDAIGVLLASGPRTFSNAVFHAFNLDPVKYAFVTDFDRDGAPDLFGDCQGCAGTGPYSHGYQPGNGLGNFRPFVTVSGIAATTDAIFPVDLDGDGKPELVQPYGYLDGGSGLTTFLVLDGGQVQLAATTPPFPMAEEQQYSVTWVESADFDKDGIPDVMVPMGIFSDLPEGEVAIYRGLGGGMLGAPVFVDTGVCNSRNTTRHFAADVDGDGRLDIVCENNTGITVIYNLSQ
jgi:hypothetical protein